MKLPAIQGDQSRRPSPADLANIELIAASIGFPPYGRQIRVDGRHGLRMLAKADELRMMPIPACPASQYRASQKTFPPESDKAFCIEM